MGAEPDQISGKRDDPHADHPLGRRSSLQRRAGGAAVFGAQAAGCRNAVRALPAIHESRHEPGRPARSSHSPAATDPRLVETTPQATATVNLFICSFVHLVICSDWSFVHLVIGTFSWLLASGFKAESWIIYDQIDQ